MLLDVVLLRALSAADYSFALQGLRSPPLSLQRSLLALANEANETSQTPVEKGQSDGVDEILFLFLIIS